MRADIEKAELEYLSPYAAKERPDQGPPGAHGKMRSALGISTGQGTEYFIARLSGGLSIRRSVFSFAHGETITALVLPILWK